MGCDVDALAGAVERRLALAPDEVALPALRDAHIHLVEAARTVNQVDLSDAAALAAALRSSQWRMAGYPTEPGSRAPVGMFARWDRLATAADLDVSWRTGRRSCGRTNCTSSGSTPRP